MVMSLISSIRKRMKPWVVFTLLVVVGVAVCFLAGAREYPEVLRVRECPYQMEGQDCLYRENSVPKF